MGATPCGLASAHLHHPPIFLQAGCPSCSPTNSVKALKASHWLVDFKSSLTPRSLSDSELWCWKLSVLYVYTCCYYCRYVRLHLSILNCICHKSLSFCSSAKLFWSSSQSALQLALPTSFGSTANFRTVLLIPLPTSSMKIRNRIGPSLVDLHYRPMTSWPLSSETFKLNMPFPILKSRYNPLESITRKSITK